MRLAVLFDNFGPYHLARLQASSAGVDLVAVQTAKQSAEYAWQSAAQTASFRVVTLFDSRTSRQVTASELSARISSCLAQLNPEVVAIPGWSSQAAFAALRWGLLAGVPVVAMSESTSWDESRVSWKEWLKRQLVGCFSSALVGGEPHVDYLAQLGMPRDRIFLGYDAVDNEYFRRNTETLKSETLKKEARKQHGLPERYFLASARFIEKKNLARFLEAYAIYREKAETLKAEKPKLGDASPRPNDSLPPTRSAHGGPLPAPNSLSRFPSGSSPQGGEGVLPWDLMLLGDGRLRGTLNSQLSTLNLHGHVQMPGFKQYPDLPTYYGCASAFIHASTSEQWGLVVNEAMASGLPVLVSNRCGCAADLVQEGVNGFTFDPYDVEALAQLMLKLSTLNSGQLPTLGQASQRIIADWGPDRFASGLKAAADKAHEVGPKQASLLDRVLLKALRHR